MIHKRIDFVPTRANIQPRRTKRRSKRGIKLEIERNGNHRRRDGRFGHVCAFNVRLFVQWPYPKLVGITRRHGSKQGRRIGAESRVLSLINKARGLGCHLFSLSLSLLFSRISWKLSPSFPLLSFSTSSFLHNLCSSIYLGAFSAHAATCLSDIINISRDLNC